MMYDYVVIGGGVSGMASAIILAKNGLRVALVEKSGTTGPLIRGFSRSGIHFDTGLHFVGALGRGELLDTLLNYLGIGQCLEKGTPSPHGFALFRCIQSDFEFVFPSDPLQLREILHAHFPQEKIAIDTFLDDVKEIYHSIPYLNLDKDRFLQHANKGRYGPSLKQYLERITDNETLQWVLSFHCFLHGVPSEEVAFNPKFHGKNGRI